MRRKLETIRDKKDLIKSAMDCMQTEIDRITNDHNDHLKRLFESHNAQISETKRKQWVCSSIPQIFFIILYVFIFSVIIVNKMPYIIAVGIQRIVQQPVNSNTGRRNIKKYVVVSVR